MDIDERQSRIADLVAARKRVKALELSRTFDVSVETIRKDLLDLQEQGALVRVHGGAQMRPGRQESAYDRRRSSDNAAKAAIAAAAVADLSDHTTVYLDYGTTTFAVASALVRSGLTLTVVTNALPIAEVLAESDRIETILLGGTLRRNEKSLFGPIAERTLELLHMDVGFFGCAGLHPAAGITNPHLAEAATSHKAMTHCASVVVVADSSKFDVVAAHTVADLHQIDALICEEAPPAALDTALRDADTSIVITQEDGHGLP